MGRARLGDFACFFLSLTAMVISFFAIMFGWSIIDLLGGRLETSRFIHDHSALVKSWNENPLVYAFAIQPDADHSGTLAIRIDVEDRKTYELIERDLDGIWELTFPPTFEINIRSGEELDNNYGFAAWGVGLAMVAVFRIGIAVALSVISFFATIWWLVVRPTRSRRQNNYRSGNVST